MIKYLKSNIFFVVSLFIIFIVFIITSNLINYSCLTNHDFIYPYYTSLQCLYF